MDILIARPYSDAKKLASLFEERGISTAILPSIRIVNKRVNFNSKEFTDFVFTSKYAVESLFADHSSKELIDKNVYSIGKTTAKHLLKYGLNAKYSQKYNSAELFKLIQQENHLGKRKFAIVSGVGGNDYLEKNVRKFSQCQKIKVYERIFEDKEALYREYQQVYFSSEPKVIITTSLDVFKSLNRIFKYVSVPKDCITTITSPKMLNFVNSQGFYNTLNLEKLDNEYICKKVLDFIGVKDYVGR